MTPKKDVNVAGDVGYKKYYLIINFKKHAKSALMELKISTWLY